MTALAIEKLLVDIDVKIKPQKLLVWQAKAPTSQKASRKNHVCVFVNAKFMISFTFDTLAITSSLLSFLKGQGDLFMQGDIEQDSVRLQLTVLAANNKLI